MRKALLTLALTLLLATAFVGAQAQTTTFYYATHFNWTIQGQQANTYTFFPISVCQVPGGQQNAGTFFPFNTNASVFIQDATAANNDIVTPSTVIKTSAQCGITATPSHSHYSFSLRSGTAGLQEALNTLKNTATQKTPVVLDKAWYTQLSATGQNAATVIAAAAGSTGVYLVDVTTSPYTFYSWSGTAYAGSTSSPVTTITSATPSTTRLISADMTVTPATTVTIGSGSGSLVGTRGSVTLTTGKTLSAGYIYGAQGKAIINGTSNTQSGGGIIAGVFGQLDTTGGTITNTGLTAAGAFDIGGTGVAASVDNVKGIVITNSTSTIAGAAIHIGTTSGGFANVISIDDSTNTMANTTGTCSGTGSSGYFKVKVGSTVVKVPFCT